MDPHKFLQKLLLVALEKSSIKSIVPESFASFDDFPQSGCLKVFSIGKAAIDMAKSFEDSWKGKKFKGIALTTTEAAKNNTKVLKNFQILEASHPFCNEKGVIASNRILKELEPLTDQDRVILMLSGGASSLLAGLPESGSLETQNHIVKSLMSKGADIITINRFRRAYSNIRGGRLAAKAAPAKVITLAISDVAGDDVRYIGSGPTVADSENFEDLSNVLKSYDIKIPHELKDAAHNLPKKLNNTSIKVILTPMNVLDAVCDYAKKAGFNVLPLGDLINGDAIESAKFHVAIAESCAVYGSPCKLPALIVSGGELTTNLSKNPGKGGPNSTFALEVARLISGKAIYALAVDTDGKDGSQGMGGIVDSETLNKLQAKGIDATKELKDNNAYEALASVGSGIAARVTGTNINDFRAILIT